MRGPDYDFKPEIKELENLVQESDTSELMEKVAFLTSRRILIPFMIMAIMIMLQVINHSISVSTEKKMILSYFFSPYPDPKW